jgi:hypothetical protein
MTGDQWQGVAAFTLAIGSLAGTIGTLVMQFRTSKVAQSNADKLDAQAGKIDEVHAATTVIAEQTGVHKTLSG